MTRTVTALGDRLLGLLVPQATAAAEPCGPLDNYFCYCVNSSWYSRNCCRYSGACYPCRVTARCPV